MNESLRKGLPEEMFKFIESLEDFKHCEDEVRAAALFESLKLTINHVPGHLIKSEEVNMFIQFV